MNWKKFLATMFGIGIGAFVLVLLILAGTFILTRPETSLAQVPTVVEQGSNSTYIDANESNSHDFNALEVNNPNTMDFGVYGEYEIVFDSNREQYTLGWWNENMVREGSKNLADLKREGGTLTFVIPKDGWINNSAGTLYIDGVEWDLGNYAENQLEETMISEGQTITVSYGPENDSAGFQLWFK